MSALFQSMDLFLSISLSGNQDQTRLVFAGSLRPKLVPKLALYLRMLPDRLNSFARRRGHTLRLGFVSKHPSIFSEELASRQRSIVPKTRSHSLVVTP
jgi:hypothetical protein